MKLIRWLIRLDLVRFNGGLVMLIEGIHGYFWYLVEFGIYFAFM